MKKQDIKKAAGAGVLSLGLVFGLAGFAGAASGTIGTTGPDSDNEITHESSVEMDFDNDNDLSFTNSNGQGASSGSAETEGNIGAPNIVVYGFGDADDVQSLL